MVTDELIAEIGLLKRESELWRKIKTAYKTDGVHLATLVSVLQFHEKSVDCTIHDVAEDIGLEYATAQKYLKKLCRNGILREVRKRVKGSKRSRLVYTPK